MCVQHHINLSEPLFQVTLRAQIIGDVLIGGMLHPGISGMLMFGIDANYGTVLWQFFRKPAEMLQSMPPISWTHFMPTDEMVMLFGIQKKKHIHPLFLSYTPDRFSRLSYVYNYKQEETPGPLHTELCQGSTG